MGTVSGLVPEMAAPALLGGENGCLCLNAVIVEQQKAGKKGEREFVRGARNRGIGLKSWANGRVAGYLGVGWCCASNWGVAHIAALVRGRRGCCSRAAWRACHAGASKRHRRGVVLRERQERASALVHAVLGFKDDAGLRHFDAVSRAGGHLHAYVAAVHISTHFSRVIISPFGPFMLMSPETSIW